MDLVKMKYWVFDLDGTLIDSFAAYFRILEELIGTKLTPQTKREYIGIHPTKILSSHLSETETAQALKVLQKRSEQDASSIVAFEAILPMLQLLKENECSMSVWTSRDLKSATAILNNLDLAKYFDYVISGECVLERKPHPEGLLRIQELYQCSAAKMVMVGDHVHDMEAAQTAKVLSVRASWHGQWDDGACSVSNKQFKCDRLFHDWIRSEVGHN
jgi:HAD superfamily hydrolase (TIGR01549 family)